LQQKPKLNGFAVSQLNDKTLEVEVSAPQTISDLFVALSAQNIQVATMKNKTNRLEELVVKLTSDNHNE